jgi:hypothetical protein
VQASFETVLECFDLLLEPPPIRELEQAEPCISRTGDHRADRGVDPRDAHAVGVDGLTRRPAERLTKRVAKSAVRRVARIEHGIIHRAAVAQLFEGAREASRAQ